MLFSALDRYATLYIVYFVYLLCFVFAKEVVDSPEVSGV